jgi:hypothetical protein
MDTNQNLKNEKKITFYENVIYIRKSKRNKNKEDSLPLE